MAGAIHLKKDLISTSHLLCRRGTQGIPKFLRLRAPGSGLQAPGSGLWVSGWGAEKPVKPVFTQWLSQSYAPSSGRNGRRPPCLKRRLNSVAARYCSALRFFFRPYVRKFWEILDEPYARDLQAQGACALRFFSNQAFLARVFLV